MTIWALKVKDGGEFWIGSRSCRYQYKATITLYGDVDAMTEGPVGRKYVWCSTGSVCEFHGQEKRSWTLLDDTMFKMNSPVDVRRFDYTPDGARPSQGADGLMLHRFSR